MKLYALKRFDHDSDGIPSFQEDLDGDGYMWIKLICKMELVNPDDTDRDGIPDF